MNWRPVLVLGLFSVVIVSMFALSLYFANLGPGLYFVDVQASAEDGLSLVVVGAGNLSAATLYVSVEDPFSQYVIADGANGVFYLAADGYLLNRSSVIEAGQHVTVLEYYYNSPSVGTSLHVVARDQTSGFQLCDVRLTVGL